jgi:hypothetical protein
MSYEIWGGGGRGAGDREVRVGQIVNIRVKGFGPVGRCFAAVTFKPLILGVSGYIASIFVSFFVVSAVL